MPDEERFDLDFRPEDYFEPEDRTGARLAYVPKARRAKAVKEALARGETVPDYILEPAPAECDPLETLWYGNVRFALQSSPFLPSFRPGEVEIATVHVASVNSDTISIRARPGSDRIRYRVVDEYPDLGEYCLTRKSSRKPLTLRQLIEIIDTAEHRSDGFQNFRGLVAGIREMNDGAGPPETLRRFVGVSSSFYPDVERWYEQEAQEWCWGKLLEAVSGEVN